MVYTSFKKSLFIFQIRQEIKQQEISKLNPRDAIIKCCFIYDLQYDKNSVDTTREGVKNARS